MKKSISFMLVSIMLLISLISVFSACSENGKKSDVSSEYISGNSGQLEPVTSDSVMENPDAEYLDENGKYAFAGAEGKSYEGYTFTIWTNSSENTVWYDMDFSVDAESDDPLDVAAYKRMLDTSEKLDVEIEAIPIGAWIGVDSELRDVLSGDSEFDALMTNVRSAATLSREGCFLDLKSTSLDLNAPWWDSNLTDDLTVGDSLYMTIGDIAVSYKKSLCGIMFNQKIIDDHKNDTVFGDGDLYALAADNEWTWDKLISMSKAVGTDVNNDSTFDCGDIYGYLYFNDCGATNLLTCGVNMILKDSNGQPYDSFWNDKTSMIWDKLIEFYNTDFSAINGSSYAFDYSAMYMSDQILFLALELHSIEDFRDMDADFGVLPCPKWDSSQETYITTVNPNVACLLAIPTDSPNPERTCTVLDTMGAYSKNILTPAYCETYMTKVYRDERMLDMLNIIFENVSYDMGYMYDWGGIGSLTPVMLLNKQSDLSSRYAAIKEVISSEIRLAIDDYASIN